MDPYTNNPAQKAMREAIGRAIVLASHDRFAEAMTLLEEAIRDYGDTPDSWLYGAYCHLAEAAAMVGQTDKSLATARKALDMLAVVGAHQHPTTLRQESAHIYEILALNHFLRGERRETYEALERCRLAGFFYRGVDSYHDVSMIYTPAVLSAIGDCGIDAEQAVIEAGRESGSQVRTYPDGSVQIDGPGSRQFHTGAFGFLLFMESVLRGGDEFKLKARKRLFTAGVPQAFGERHLCTINLWGDWVGKWGSEDFFHVRTWPFANSAAVDRRQVPVTVVFKRRLSNDARTKFMDMLADWAGSVRSEGVFGEGPMVPAEPTVTFYTKAAQFSLNAAASGPHTLVGFILSLLAFCPVAILVKVWFTPMSLGWLEHFGINGQQGVLLPLRNG